MSDTPQPGWWQASDGRWYPPEQHPENLGTPDAGLPLGPPSYGGHFDAPGQPNQASGPKSDPFNSNESGRSRPKWIWPAVGIGAVLLVALLVGIVAVGTGSDSGGSANVEVAAERQERETTTTEVVSTTAVPTTARRTTSTTTVPARTFTNADWEELATDPDGWSGASVDVVGRLLDEPERDGSTVYFQMFTTADSEGTTAIVMYSGDSNVPLAGDVWVRVKGTVQGDFTGSNAFGGDIRAVSLRATEITPSSAVDALPPPIRQVGHVGEATQNGVLVKLDRVDYAADETRAFVAIQNNSNESFTLYTYSARAVQGGVQVDQESTFADYPDLPSDLLPGAIAVGVITFPPLDPNQPTRMVFEGRSDNYRVDFTPWEFNVP